MSEYQQIVQQALSLLHAGDVQKAVHTFRPVLSYPGLVEQPDEFSEALQALAEISMYHRPNQILWSHTTCWTKGQPITADLTTFLYQKNTEPWGEQLIVDPESHQTNHRPADQRDPTIIAAELTSAKLVESLAEDEPQLLALARAAALAEENILALSCEEDQRQKLWVGSPVPSNLFR
jgi:hypothetical protein